MTFRRFSSLLAAAPFCAILALSLTGCAGNATAGLKAGQSPSTALAAKLDQVEPAAGDKKVAKKKAKAEADKKAEKKKQAQAHGHMPDPIEPVNRAVFMFNDMLDQVLIGPIASVYNALVPSFVRDGVQNVTRNLRAPISAANSLLQGDVKQAGVTTARFVLNSTVGLGGVFDVAKGQGLRHRGEDFGQTLGAWGVKPGAYVVLPILGPTSLRDGLGIAADSQADPLRIWSFKTGHDWIYYTRNGLEALDARARIDRGIRDLRRNSLDYYAAVRSAYAQKRASEIRNEDASAPRIPDYNEKFE